MNGEEGGVGVEALAIACLIDGFGIKGLAMLVAIDFVSRSCRLSNLPHVTLLCRNQRSVSRPYSRLGMRCIAYHVPNPPSLPPLIQTHTNTTGPTMRQVLA